MSQQPASNLGGFLFALIALAAGIIAANMMLYSSATIVRAGAVAVAITAHIPWALVVIRGIRNSDEFTRHVHTLALSISFGGVATCVVVLHWLQRADLIGPIRITTLGMLGVYVWWWLAMMIASRRYR